jgi:hypothetical protein
MSPTRVQVVSASLLSTFSSTHINELRFGYTRFRNSFTSADAVNPKNLGLDFGTGHTGLPEIDFNATFENLGATVFSIPRARVSQNYRILDNFTWIRGRHSLKFGGETRRAWGDAFNDNFERGIIQFFPCGCLGPQVSPQGGSPDAVFSGKQRLCLSRNRQNAAHNLQ